MPSMEVVPEIPPISPSFLPQGFSQGVSFEDCLSADVVEDSADPLTFRV